jgi:hypothetical protein
MEHEFPFVDWNLGELEERRKQASISDDRAYYHSKQRNFCANERMVPFVMGWDGRCRIWIL